MNFKVLNSSRFLAVGSLPCAKEILQEMSQSRKQWLSIPLFQFVISLISYLDDNPSEWQAFIKQNSPLLEKYPFIKSYLSLINAQFFKNQGSFGMLGDFMKNLMGSETPQLNNNSSSFDFDFPVEEDVD